jgi:hypothetical protein
MLPAEAMRNEAVDVGLSFQTPAGREISALQWESIVSSVLFDFRDVIATISPDAQNAGKSINCAIKSVQTNGLKTVGCIVYGGQQPIPNGVVARIHLRVLPESTPGIARMRIENGLAVTKELQRFTIAPSEGGIRIGTSQASSDKKRK